MMKNNTELQMRLADIRSVFDVDEIINRPTTIPNIKKYYRTNRISYWYFHSREGFMHMGLSKGDRLSESDVHGQAELISDYIKKNRAKNVLELAMGKGANSQYLASRHPKVNFYGFDLPNGQLKVRRFSRVSNLTAEYGDYNDLSRYEAESMDIVFVIEALCYSRNKSKVLQEVKRVLKPDGVFIVFDGYNARSVADYTDDEILTLSLTWKGMIAEMEGFDVADADPLYIKNGFIIVRSDDLSQQILPTLNKFEVIAAKFFRHPKLARIVIKFVPKAFSANVISGYLMPYTIKHKLSQYRLIISKPAK